jgi:hypothetical protein
MVLTEFRYAYLVAFLLAISGLHDTRYGNDVTIQPQAHQLAAEAGIHLVA